MDPSKELESKREKVMITGPDSKEDHEEKGTRNDRNIAHLLVQKLFWGAVCKMYVP